MIHQISSFNDLKIVERVQAQIFVVRIENIKKILLHIKTNILSSIPQSVVHFFGCIFSNTSLLFQTSKLLHTWLRLLSMYRLSMSMKIVCLLHSKYFQQLDNIPNVWGAIPCGHPRHHVCSCTYVQ